MGRNRSRLHAEGGLMSGVSAMPTTGCGAAEYRPTPAEQMADRLGAYIAFKLYSTDDDVIREAAAMLRRMDRSTTREGGEGVLMPAEPTEKAIEAIRRYRDSGCSIHNLYTAIRRALATTSSPDASPDSGEVAGTFACPICGDDTPHHHTAPVVDAYHTKGARS